MCEISMDGMQLKHIRNLKFTYLGFVLDKFGKDEVESSIKVANGRKFADVIRSLVYGRDLKPECARCCEQMVQKEKEGSRIRVVEMNSFRRLIRSKEDRKKLMHMLELYGVKKRVDEKIDDFKCFLVV